VVTRNAHQRRRAANIAIKNDAAVANRWVHVLNDYRGKTEFSRKGCTDQGGGGNDDRGDYRYPPTRPLGASQEQSKKRGSTSQKANEKKGGYNTRPRIVITPWGDNIKLLKNHDGRRIRGKPNRAFFVRKFGGKAACPLTNRKGSLRQKQGPQKRK